MCPKSARFASSTRAREIPCRLDFRRAFPNDRTMLSIERRFHLKTKADEKALADVHDSLNAHRAGLVIALADSETMLLLCKHIADTIGIEAIDGLGVIDWFNREKIRRLQKVLEDIETTSPSLAATLSESIDRVKREHGIADPDDHLGGFA